MINPLIFMVPVSGKPNCQKIEQYLYSLKKVGIEQVMIYPRSGCELEYLSSEWFETVGVFLKYVKQLDMKAWLYDDFNWPSGDAGGMITKNPKHCLQVIRIAGENRGQIVYASKGGDVLYFGENSFTNLMSEDAVNCFIGCTHEEYYKRFAECFGDTIVGIFTDEPAVGYGCGEGSLPYYDELPEDYYLACGRDFYNDLENENCELTTVAMDVIADRFKKTYIDKLAKWCKNHGIIMTGHLMNDCEPFNSVRANGNLLKCLSGFILPGVDEIRTNLKDEWLYTLFGVAEYAAGEHGAMAELFALGPCELTYTTKLCMMFLASCFKIDHYFLALSHLDFRGNMKIKDYFNQFGVDQPDFEGMKTFARFADIAAKYARQDYKADVYIRYPSRVCARNLKSGIDDYPLAVITEALVSNQIQWKFIADDDMPSDAPIIEFENDFKYRLGDVVTDDAKLICQMLPHNPMVYDVDGNLPDGLFVRRYLNGDYIVINVKGNADTYIISGEQIYLDESGVTGSLFCPNKSCTKKEKADINFDITHVSQNITRVLYSGLSEAIINCESEKEICFAVRNGESIVVNNERIAGKNKTVLTSGFEDMYSDSDRVVLKKGVNIIKADNDFCFMPSAFIIGDFYAKHDTDHNTVMLLDRKSKLTVGERFEEYGVVELKGVVDIPKEAIGMKIEGTVLFTKVYINGILIDEKIVAPYLYDVSRFKGERVDLKIVQYSSMAPMFGDSDKFVRTSILFSKRNLDNSLLFGMDAIYFI